MKEVINNNSKYKLKYWFAMLYILKRKFMIGSMFTYQRLSKDYFLLIYQNLGANFLCNQKRLLISKTPCIYPGMDRDIYVQKIFEIIKDRTNFKELSTDSTVTRDGQLQGFLRSMKDKQVFAKETYENIYPSSSK